MKEYDDLISYAISRDNLNWSNNIENIASINNGILVIQPKTKSMVGNQNLYLKAFDLSSAQTTIQLSIDVLNVNEMPQVNKKDAIKLTSNLWQEEIILFPGQPDSVLDIENIFSDPDLNDFLNEIYPVLPSWITFETRNDVTGGILKFSPKDGDVGEYSFDFNAFDQSGIMVTYRLKIDVQNINDPPTVIDNPDLTSLGEIINGIPNILEGEYSSLNPNNLFEDKDFIFGDSSKF